MPAVIGVEPLVEGAGGVLEVGPIGGVLIARHAGLGVAQDLLQRARARGAHHQLREARAIPAFDGAGHHDVAAAADELDPLAGAQVAVHRQGLAGLDGDAIGGEAEVGETGDAEGLTGADLDGIGGAEGPVHQHHARGQQGHGPRGLDLAARMDHQVAALGLEPCAAPGTERRQGAGAVDAAPLSVVHPEAELEVTLGGDRDGHPAAPGQVSGRNGLDRQAGGVLPAAVEIAQGDVAIVGERVDAVGGDLQGPDAGVGNEYESITDQVRHPVVPRQGADGAPGGQGDVGARGGRAAGLRQMPRQCVGVREPGAGPQLSDLDVRIGREEDGAALAVGEQAYGFGPQGAAGVRGEVAVEHADLGQGQVVGVAHGQVAEPGGAGGEAVDGGGERQAARGRGLEVQVVRRERRAPLGDLAAGGQGQVAGSGGAHRAQH